MAGVMAMRLMIPESLPISAYQDELRRLLCERQVVIVCGDTGSGKTTQLPKLALLARPEVRGLVGVTQPRRLAAMAMARRLAEEVGTPVGGMVGYQHRFERRLSRETRIKLMTDGVLLAEAREDPLFRRYHTLIIDEAHERSLNIDFLLGLLHRVLVRRRDLRVVISSATLDAEGFSGFFGGAPVVSIPGRLFPIEQVWLGDVEASGEDADGVDVEELPRQVANAVDYLGEDSGDILVFLPGEREIREVKGVLEGRRIPRTEVLPLLASLPPGEQNRVFQPSALRRIVLATNVAETSVTIPGIRAVIDSGLARIKRYSTQRHVQTLRVEKVSQASARQRMGRCGRVGPGVCVRLYSEADFAGREEHMVPEIKRTALAGVILKMADLRLGAIEDFPFLEAPTGAAIREGYRELLELGALARREAAEGEPKWGLTGMGRALAAFPVEPRFARILLAAESECVLREALTVVAALACEDPLLRPIEKREQADQQHARFRCGNSDFLGRLRLWAWWEDAALGTSETQRRKRCKAAFVSYPRMREWANVRAQLEELCVERRLHVADGRGGEAGLHRALLCGLLSRIGHYDGEAREYRGAFGVRFTLFPGSGLAKEAKKEGRGGPGKSAAGARGREARGDVVPMSREWVVAAELVETSRLFGRMVACIDPRWIEPIAGALCKVHRHSAFWDREHGFVRVHENVTLFGLPLASGRLRDLSALDPAAARRFFIADGLAVPDAILHPPGWLRENWQRQRLLGQLWALNRRAVDDLQVALIDFYEAHLPADICHAPGLKRCPPLPLKGAAFEVAAETLRDFPEELQVGGERFTLVYRHEPGAPDDGVTIESPPERLHLLAQWHAEWLVPGLLPEKIMWLLNALPSRVRHVLGPLPELQSLILGRVKPYSRPLSETLFRLLRDERGVRVDEAPWAEERLPAHLRMNFRVVEAGSGKVLGQGRLLKPLLTLFATGQAAPEAHTLADPALAHLANRKQCLEALWKMGATGWRTATQLPALSAATKAFLKRAEISQERLGEELRYAILAETFLPAELTDPKTAEELAQRYAARKGRLSQIAGEWRRRIVYVLDETARLERAVEEATGVYPETQEAILDQLAWLVFDGFVGAVPPMWLAHYPIFLQAIAERLERARLNPSGDRRKSEQIKALWARYTDFVTRPKQPRHDPIALSAYRWEVECLRVAIFAPSLQPLRRTSQKQLDALWAKVLAP